MIDTFLIFGASGDLTSRYLLPSMARLHECGRLPQELIIRGVARDNWDEEDFRTHARAKLAEHAADVSENSREALVERLEYVSADVTDAETLSQAIETGKPVVAYLALPPNVFAQTTETLHDAGMADGSRIVIEKPFGVDLESARELNALLRRTFPECMVFRLDHFLGQQTVQNILGLRFANRVFEPLWSRQHIERVDILWDETLALEGRAGYYDQTGALKDMIQNHLLQLMALLAMEPPSSLNERDLRDRKAELLRAVHQMSAGEAARHTVRGRYAAGEIGDREVPAYIEEEGVEPGEKTETFAQVTLTVDNWRWADVPFTLRSGKALGTERKAVVVHFREVPHLAFGQSAKPPANVLVLTFEPDTVSLGVSINGPGDPFDLEWVDLRTELAPQSIPAYGRLLLDVIEGDLVLSIRDDEAEEAWRVVEPILNAWDRDTVPIEEYPAGSDGPVDPPEYPQ